MSDQQHTPVCPIAQTGQTSCYDAAGSEIPCPGSGQDGESRLGCPWPVPRFTPQGETTIDLLTGLTWATNANLAEFPLTWQEALDFVAQLNIDRFAGQADWRLPNRKELVSLMSYQTRKPALPDGHPFSDVFLGWYWSSTSAAINPGYAWYVHMEGARMFYGRKDQYYLLWPVRGASPVLPRTGQTLCYDQHGNPIAPAGSGQDGELQLGQASPVPRFSDQGQTVLDHLTGLIWLKDADLTGEPVSWQEALAAIDRLNNDQGTTLHWQLPPINALESLVDCSQASPALPAGHPFQSLRDVYWSATTSYFETDWAWALYLEKGALGVGHKPGRTFHVWPVAVP